MTLLIRKQIVTGTLTKAKPYIFLHRGGYGKTTVGRALARLALVQGPTTKCEIVFPLSFFMIFGMTGRADRNPLTPSDVCGSLSALQKVNSFPANLQKISCIIIWSLARERTETEKKKIFCQTLMQLLR